MQRPGPCLLSFLTSLHFNYSILLIGNRQNPGVFNTQDLFVQKADDKLPIGTRCNVKMQVKYSNYHVICSQELLHGYYLVIVKSTFPQCRVSCQSGHPKSALLTANKRFFYQCNIFHRILRSISQVVPMPQVHGLTKGAKHNSS